MKDLREIILRNYGGKGITYHKDEDRQLVERYLIKNDILTNDNIIKLNSIKWNSRIDGFDGVAGKKRSDGYLCGDSIKFIIHNGRRINPKYCKKKISYDEWGVRSFELNTKQFK